MGINESWLKNRFKEKDKMKTKDVECNGAYMSPKKRKISILGVVGFLIIIITCYIKIRRSCS